MFSASDAAFSGFRAGREHARAMLVWIVVFGLASIALTLWMIPAMGATLMEMQAVGQQTRPDPAAVQALMAKLTPMVGPILLYALVLSAVQTTAANRLVLRPADSGFGFLRLGAAEFRQFVVTVAMMVILNIATFGLLIVVTVAATAAAAISPILGAFVGAVAFIAAASAIAILLVRLSLAGAQTFATGRINLFGSWSLTRGKFWPMLGAYLLSFVMVVIVWVALQAIVMLAVVLFGGGFAAVGAMYQPDMSSLTAFLTPATIVRWGAALVAAPFLQLIVLCPAPDIYRSLTAGAR